MRRGQANRSAPYAYMDARRRWAHSDAVEGQRSRGTGSGIWLSARRHGSSIGAASVMRLLSRFGVRGVVVDVDLGEGKRVQLDRPADDDRLILHTEN